MNVSCSFRRGDISDLPQIQDIIFEAYVEYKHVLTPEHWATLESGLKNVERLEDLVLRSASFVCEAENKIVGTAFLVPSGNGNHIFHNDWSYIRLVGVHPRFRGMGISFKLTRLCIDFAKAHNESIIALHTSEFMDAARHIYEKCGFTQLKEIEPMFGKRYWLYLLNLANDR